MTIKDISRHLFQPTRHYSGLRMQQGRLLLDADFNEAEMLGDEDQRLALTDIIGPHGSSDDGFLVTAPSLVEFDFTLKAGSYYVGGLRLDLEVDETFLAQGDWLQSSRSDVTLPDLPVADRDDLIYLVAWEQEVSALEDNELLEEALEGADTSVRVRRMHRVQAVNDTDPECHVAFDALVTALKGGVHDFDARSGELLSETRLTVEPNDIPGEGDDLCQPSSITGYLGADNQAIRVQVIDTDKFIWSYDNASPLYRIELPVEAEADVYTITFLTPPADQAHHPLVGQVLELLPWGAELGNDEKAADHPIAPGLGGGLYARVKTPYDPTTGTLTVELSGSALAPYLAWYAALDPEITRYLYVRHWNPGDNGSGAVGVTFAPATPVALAGTGLKITFSTAGLVGDFWIITARPHTPETVVPWDLQDGAAPHGPRRFYAPLGMLHWTNDGGLAVTTESCRRTFRPLTEQGGCCTVTVGDGNQSFGDYRTINEALAALPPSGGKVCVFPGVYEERVLLSEGSDIVIEGCGDRSVIRTPDDNDTSAGLVTLTGCVRITLRDLAIEATGQIGVLLMPDSGGEQGPITLEGLSITTRRDPSEASDPAESALWLTTSPAPFPCPTIAADQITGLEICRCTLTMIGHYSAMPNVVLQAALESLVRDCTILTPAPSSGTTSEAWGGLQLAGGCEHVQVLHNEIKGGMGHGVTLGNVLYGTATPLTFADTFTLGNTTIIDPGMDCPGVWGGIDDLAAPPGGGDDVTTSPGPELNHISIVDNVIHGMHASGISVVAFWPEPDELSGPTAFKMIQTHDLLIDHNRIVDNCRKLAENLLDDPSFLDVLAFGGIALASANDLRIFDNNIVDNGENHLRPLCGVFVLHGENIDIERNLIKRNGIRGVGDGLSGVRAGIAVQMAGRRIFYTGDELSDVDDDNLYPAARIRGNTVIQPAGRSLQLYGLGPMVIEGNHLVNEGLTGTVPPESAHAVEIINLGQSPELIADGSMPSFYGFLPTPPLQGDPDVLDERLIDGRILYTKNQVRLKVQGAASANMECAVRLLSHGDILMHGNQHLTTFDRDVGFLSFSTMAIGWSVHATQNRLEDTHIDNRVPTGIITAVSLITTGTMSITALNIATRCVLSLPVTNIQLTNPNEHHVNNIVYYEDAGDCLGIAQGIAYWYTFPG